MKTANHDWDGVIKAVPGRGKQQLGNETEELKCRRVKEGKGRGQRAPHKAHNVCRSYHIYVHSTRTKPGPVPFLSPVWFIRKTYGSC